MAATPPVQLSMYCKWCHDMNAVPHSFLKPCCLKKKEKLHHHSLAFLVQEDASPFKTINDILFTRRNQLQVLFLLQEQHLSPSSKRSTRKAFCCCATKTRQRFLFFISLTHSSVLSVYVFFSPQRLIK